jgi:hypothetical protein
MDQYPQSSSWITPARYNVSDDRARGAQHPSLLPPATGSSDYRQHNTATSTLSLSSGGGFHLTAPPLPSYDIVAANRSRSAAPFPPSSAPSLISTGSSRQGDDGRREWLPPHGQPQQSQQHHRVDQVMERRSGEGRGGNHHAMLMPGRSELHNQVPLTSLGDQRSNVRTIDLVSLSSGGRSAEEHAERKRGRAFDGDERHRQERGSDGGHVVRRVSPWLAPTATTNHSPRKDVVASSLLSGERSAKIYRVDSAATNAAVASSGGWHANTREVDVSTLPPTRARISATGAASREVESVAEKRGGGVRRSLVLSRTNSTSTSSAVPAAAATTAGLTEGSRTFVDLTSKPTPRPITRAPAPTADDRGERLDDRKQEHQLLRRGGSRLVVDTTTPQLPPPAEAAASRTYRAPSQITLPTTNSGSSSKSSVMDFVQNPSATRIFSHPSPRDDAATATGSYVGLSPKSAIDKAMRRANDFNLPSAASGPSRSYIVPVAANRNTQMSLIRSSHYQPVATLLNLPSTSTASAFTMPTRLVVDTTLSGAGGGSGADTASGRQREKTYDGITLIRTTQQQQQQNGGVQDSTRLPDKRHRSPTPPRPRPTTALSRRGGSNLVFDTSSFIKIFEWAKEHLLDKILDRHRIYIPSTTLDELDKMSKQQQQQQQQQQRSDRLTGLAMNCRKVRDWITTKTLEDEELQRHNRSASRGYSSATPADTRRIFIQRRTDVDPEYDRRAQVNDDYILGYAVYLRNIRGITDVPIVFVTEDKMLCLKASSENFTCVSIQKLVDMEESSFQLLDR